MRTKKTILIVDDDALVLESVDLHLSTIEGFQTIRVLGSAGAANHMSQAKSIDIVIADVLLSGSVTGIDICESAIRQNPAVAIVVITADTEVQRVHIPPRGVLLRKPFGAEQLLESIETALAKASLASTLEPRKA